MSGCAGSQKKITQQEKEYTTMTSDIANTGSGNYYGIYWGILSCADSSGTRKTLKINSDTTDKLRSEYFGKRNGGFGENGIYNIVNENIIKQVTPSSEKKTSGAVALSNSLRMLNSSEFAKYYILKKQ